MILTVYYVDAAAAGDGSGGTPANAFVSALSVPWNLTSCDVAWVRRSHAETMADSSWLGPVAGDGAEAGIANQVFIVGWPSSGYPMYDQRPAAGVSAGWDADEAGTGVYSLFGQNVPTFSNSTNTAARGILLSMHCVYLNINVNQLGANGESPLSTSVLTLFPGMVDNFTITRQQGRVVGVNQMALPGPMGKYVYTGTGAAKFQDIFAQHVHINSSTISSGGLFSNAFNPDIEIGVIHTISNSIDALFLSGASKIHRKQRVHKVTGIKPYSGASVSAGSSWTGFVVDDWFGEGPLIEGNPRRPRMSLATSAQAMHTNSGRVIKYEVMSSANTKYGLIPRQQQILTKPFDVESGTQQTIRLPIYVDSTAVFSPRGGTIRAQLLTAGGDTIWSSSANVIAGSADNWSGTLPVGGAAWLMECVWTPQETGRARFGVYMPQFTQANSGDPLTAYVLFGQPY